MAECPGPSAGESRASFAKGWLITGRNCTLYFSRVPRFLFFPRVFCTQPIKSSNGISIDYFLISTLLSCFCCCFSLVLSSDLLFCWLSPPCLVRCCFIGGLLWQYYLYRERQRRQSKTCLPGRQQLRMVTSAPWLEVYAKIISSVAFWFTFFFFFNLSDSPALLYQCDPWPW